MSASTAYPDVTAIELLPPQARLLQALAWSLGNVDKEWLSDAADVAHNWVSEYVGSAAVEDGRLAATVRRGRGLTTYPKLVAAGLACSEDVDLDGLACRTYSITQKGRAWLAYRGLTPIQE